TEADLPELMAFLHRRGVRGYVTFNTLVFADELAAAADYLRGIIAAGVDAAIVQDAGICRLIRRLSPDFPIHGSTQMTVTSAAGVAFARRLGCDLVVLARENSLKEIAVIRSAVADFPLEVFVHGALCVAYSGQCLTSEALGGRSANRGECAQACRMPYELVSDGARVDLGDRRYLLSPQDLAGLEVLPELAASGVASLKIEGRLKSPEYVASITRVYRQALDRLAADSSEASGATRVSAADRYAMEMAFSRGLYTGWFRGINNQELAHGRFGKKRGVFLGVVDRVGRDGVVMRPASGVKAGDGVVFDAGHPDEPEAGGRVYAVREGPVSARSPREVELQFGRDALDLRRLHPGDRVWKTDDPALDREVRRTFEGETPRFRRPVTAEVHGAPGTPLTLILRDEQGNVARAESAMPLERAERHPLTEERLREQIGRLGGTPFRLESLRCELEPGLMVPVSELNRLRREAVVSLEQRRAAPRRWELRPPEDSVLRVPAGAEGAEATEAGGEPELIVLVRHPSQLEAGLTCGAAALYCDFEDPKRYRDAVDRVRAFRGNAPGPEIWIAPPRITKPGEEWILRQVRSAEADGYLVRNADHLRWFAGDRRRGDFSLNVANPLTAELFIREEGLERVTASYDLNLAQLESLAAAAPASWFEVTLHQHMPMFHMEHCVFCAFLSSGTDYTNCGRPCDRHDVRLRDRVGLEHPLKADAGCRNTVFNARAQTGAESFERLRALGLRHFRIEFVNETADEVSATLARYRALLRRETTGAQLWRDLKLENRLGVTRGQLEADGARQVFPATRRR
ncbi:MAG: U32 family peptidase, partial [Verrucomicrobiae bacterium]|nr:U32 family peptidase [Verrucomicrobiae bacterium]